MEETYQELYDRAQMYEEREKQYAESAAVHDGGENSWRGDKSVKQPRGDRGQKKSPLSASGGATHDSVPPRTPLLEYVTASRSQGPFLVISPSEAGGRKLQDRLRQPAHLRRRQHWGCSAGPRRFPRQSWRRCLLRDDCKRSSSQSLTGTTTANVVTTGQEEAGPNAVCPTLYMSVKIGGVDVEAMVDMGSQSTIISRSLLCAIGAHCRSQDLPYPELAARLFGKDGCGGG